MIYIKWFTALQVKEIPHTWNYQKGFDAVDYEIWYELKSNIN